MATGTQVLHIEKRVSIAAGLNRHITRQQFMTVGDTRTVQVWVPDNADPSRTAGNVELVSREFVNSKGQKHELTLQQAVDKRIHEAGIKPRKGQATCLEIIFSGSHDVLATMSNEELRKWADDTLEWAQKTWEEENIVSASLHVDERTPHIHMIVVPIVTGQSRRTRHQQNTTKSSRKYKIDHKKLRLCVNEVYTTGKLYAYHDSYAKEVSKKYGMERGERAEPGSKKRHTNSVEYNRMLAVQAAEQRALINELTADYTERRTGIQKDLQQLQMSREILSTAVIQEREKLVNAKTMTKDAEDRSNKAKEYLSTQANTITKNKGVIDRQVVEVNAKKEELGIIIAEIAANEVTIARQKQTIATNEAVIKKLEKVKSSTMISDDAAEEKILEKLQTVAELTAKERSLRRLIIDKQTELATADANIKRVRAQQAVEVNLDDVPKKSAFGYKKDEVTAFIQSVNVARLREAMNTAPGYVNLNKAIQEENERLRKVEDDYNALIKSPERLRQQLELVENERRRNKIAEILKYVIRDAVKVIRFACDNSTGEIFAKFTIGQRMEEYVAYLSPKDDVYYSGEEMNSLQEAKSRFLEPIWTGGNLNHIRKERAKEDTMKRYSTKLSLLTGRNVKITDYATENGCFLCFSSEGRAYYVKADGITWSTKDERVKTLGDCSQYATDNIWQKEGNINNMVNEEK